MTGPGVPPVDVPAAGPGDRPGDERAAEPVVGPGVPPESPDVPEIVLVVDAANVVGSRPDGWWRDRAGAASRLLDRLTRVVERTVTGPSGAPVHVVRVDVVLEGQARAAVDPGVPGLVVHLAPHDGDTEVVARAQAAVSCAVVVTADRGLRARLGAVPVVGPGWWHRLDETLTDPGEAGAPQDGAAPPRPS